MTAGAILAGGFFSSDGIAPEILAGFAVLGAVWGLFKAIPRTMHGIARVDTALGHVEALPEMVARSKAIDERLTRVEAELQPNGGGSFRDLVNRTAQEAKAGAAEAKAAADEVARQLVLSNAQGKQDRDRILADIKDGRGLVTVLLNALDEFAATNHQKEIAYIRALKALGIDLTDVADRLEDGDA